MKMETQVAVCHLAFVKKSSCLHHLPSKSCMLPLKFDPLSCTYPSLRANTSSSLQCVPILKSRQSLQICLAGGRGMMENNNEGRSIEEVLRQQIEKEKFDNGSSGIKPPRRGGGSGGSGDGGSAGKSNETLQVVLATIGFLFLVLFSPLGIS